MKSLFLSCLLALCLSSVYSQYQIGETCPEVCKPTELNVTADQLEGLWYVQYSIPYYYEVDGKCTYVNITKLSDTSFRFEKYVREKTDNSLLVVEGTTNFTSDGHSTHYYTSLELPLDTKLVHVSQNMYVEVACHECGVYKPEGRGIYAKVYTRVPFPSCEETDVALNLLAECGIPTDGLVVQNWENCRDCPKADIDLIQT